MYEGFLLLTGCLFGIAFPFIALFFCILHTKWQSYLFQRRADKFNKLYNEKNGPSLIDLLDRNK